MRCILFTLSILFLASSAFTQPLQFIDKNDSLKARSIAVTSDDFGAWFAAVVREDSSLFLLQFNYCGAVEQSHHVDLGGQKVSQVQVHHLGQRKYLVAAVLHDGGRSRILVFYTSNAIISSAKTITAPGGGLLYRNPMISVLDPDRILLGFEYANTSGKMSSRVVSLDQNLNTRWTRHLSDSSNLKWILMSRRDAFLVADGVQVRKYDTTGANIWTRTFPRQAMVYNSVLHDDSLVIFATDYLDPIPDTGVVKRVKYKQIIALHEDGDFKWESDRIRSIKMPGTLNEYNNRLFFNARKQVVFHGVDTLTGDSIPVLIAHRLNESGKVSESVYIPAGDTIRDYMAGLINDGNVGICAVLGNDVSGKGFLNIKASQKLDACDTTHFSILLRGFSTMHADSLYRAGDSISLVQAKSLTAVEEAFTLNRVCEKFDLQDSDIPTPLCKGDSVFLAGIQFPNAKYEWSNGSMEPGTWVKTAGKYSVKIDYCGKTATITYDVFYKMFPDVVWPDIEECNYPRRLFADRPNATYKWASGETSSFIDVSGPGTYVVSVTECQFTYKMTFTVKLPTFPNEFKHFNMCSYPDTIYAYQAPGATYLWDDGSTRGSRAISRPGNYSVTVMYCMSTFTQNFEISKLENFNLPISDSCSAFPLVLAVSKPKSSDKVKWSTGQTTDTIQVSKAGVYRATVGECDEQFTVSVKEEKILDFPNVFSPTSEIKENKVFLPYFKDASEITEYKLVVFNRWGQKVFESNKLAEGWDGNFEGNPSPIDTYTYYAEYNRGGCSDRTRVKGSVSLLR